MNLGPRARVAVYHVARGHTLRAPSLRAAWSRVVASGRAGAAVRVWNANHPKKSPPAKPPTTSPPTSSRGAGDEIDWHTVDIPFAPLPPREGDEDDDELEDAGEYDPEFSEEGEGYEFVEIETSGDYFET